MRKLVIVLAALLFIAIAVQLKDLNARRLKNAEKLSSLVSELSAVIEENKKLEKDIFYYSDPANLEKELRARFNYRLPGEELIIVVPKR